MQNRDIELRVPWAISDKKREKKDGADHWNRPTICQIKLKNLSLSLELTLNIRQSSSRQLNLPACFHGMRKIVLSGLFIHRNPGKLSLFEKKVKIKNLCVQWHLNNDWTFDYTFVHTLLTEFKKQITFQSFSRAMVAIFSGFSRQPFKLGKISLCFNCLWPISIGKWFVWVKKGEGVIAKEEKEIEGERAEGGKEDSRHKWSWFR